MTSVQLHRVNNSHAGTPNLTLLDVDGALDAVAGAVGRGSTGDRTLVLYERGHGRRRGRLRKEADTLGAVRAIFEGRPGRPSA